MRFGNLLFHATAPRLLAACLGFLLTASTALAQQGPPGCAWNKYLYAQDATQQGKVDINLLNQMSAMAAAQGYSLTNKVWQVCNGWIMEAKRANGSPAILFVDPKTQTLVDININFNT